MLGLIHQEHRAALRHDHVRQGLLAALQRQVDELAVLLHRKAAHDVGVLVRQDERADLLPRQLVELRSQYKNRSDLLRQSLPVSTQISSCMCAVTQTSMVSVCVVTTGAHLEADSSLPAVSSQETGGSVLQGGLCAPGTGYA